MLYLLFQALAKSKEWNIDVSRKSSFGLYPKRSAATCEDDLNDLQQRSTRYVRYHATSHGAYLAVVVMLPFSCAGREEWLAGPTIYSNHSATTCRSLERSIRNALKGLQSFWRY